jgi:hypothetical protein
VAENQPQVKFRVSAEGAKETADSLERVTEVLDRQRVGVKLVADANDAATQRYAAFRAEADRAQTTHTQTAASLSKMAGASAETAKQFSVNSQAVKENAARFAELGGTVTRAFGSLSPAVAQFQGVLDPLLRSLSGSLGILGGGGLAGVAAGGLIALVTGLGAAFSSAAKEAGDLAKETLENSKALGTYMQQIGQLRSQVGARIAGNVGEAQTRERLESGKGSGDEYAREVAALRELSGKRAEVDKAILAAQQQLASISPRDFVGKEPDALNKAIAAAQEEVRRLAELKNAIAAAPGQIARYQRLGASARSDEAQAREFAASNKAALLDIAGQDSEIGPAASGPAKKLDDPYAAQQREAANRKAIAAIDKMEADARSKREADEEAERKQAFGFEFSQRKEQIDQLQEQYKTAEFNKTEILSTNLQAQREEYEQQILGRLSELHAADGEQAIQVEGLKREAIRQTYEEYNRLEAEKATLIQANLQAEKRDRQAMTSSLMALGTTAAQLTAKQLSEAVKGHKIQGAMILESLGDAMVAEGVRVMFQGGAMLLMGNYASGGGLIALGAAEMAAGLGMGAAGSALQPPTAPAGGATDSGGSSPIRDTSASSNRSQNSGPTVIYIDMPTVVSPSPEDGLRIRQAIDAASRVYGAPV